MKILLEIYGLRIGDTRYWSKLKQSLKDYFTPSPNKNSAEIVVDTDCVRRTSFVGEESQIRATTKSLKEDILNMYDELEDTNWPPTSEELQEDSRLAPKSLCIFLETLIKYDDHCITEKRARLISSITQDIVFDVTRGKVMQCKHFLLALGLHRLTGFGKIIYTVQKLGHCISYNLMSDTETAQASYSLNSSKKSDILPVRPSFKNASSFSRKGKQHCWEVAIKKSLFLAAFAKLEDQWNYEEQVILTLEEYVCYFLGSKKKSVDTVQVDMFM